ncbi:hypothetical protein FACS189454_01530 [Planctomycetales bacterium]|nr:hypothetical protein FACS189454_01530 [Planctomycetales bacterium]
MKKILLYAAVLGLAFHSAAFADDYTLDGTEEPDAIPNIASNSVDAPARIQPSSKPQPAESNDLVRDGDVPLVPPILIKNPNGTLEISQEYLLVQYTQGNSRNRKPQANSDEPKQPENNAPSVGALSAMSEAERAAALKKAIWATLVANTRRGLNTQTNSPHDILLMTLPYGADAKVWQPNPNAANARKNAEPQGNAVYTVGALCWNYPCAGKTMLRTDGSRVIAKVGHGYQQRPGSLLALMAMSNIMPNYEIKVGGGTYTITNLIESEKAFVASGQNLSLELVALSFYGKTKDQWKNDLGATWSIEKMVTEELNRSIDQGTSEATDWLLGLTAAVKLYEEEKKPIRGPMALAKKQIKTYQDFVLSVQNDTHLWHPKFFLYKGTNPDAYETLFSSGHILRWLMMSLPDKELNNPQVVKAVTSLNATLNRIPSTATTTMLNDRQLEAIAVSLHALSLYHQRVFGNETPDKAVAAR